ncbi:MAG: hypothetical protein ACOCVX_02930 [Bacteroidales bacterium]|jgi:hypothetical protein
MESITTTTGYCIFPEHNLAMIVYQGHITNKDIVKCIEAQYANTILRSIPNRLIDFRNAKIVLKNSNINISNEVKHIRQKLNEHQPVNTKEAILVAQPGETAYFYLYLETSRESGKTVKCFSTLDAALNFLDIQLFDDEKDSLTENMTQILN